MSSATSSGRRGRPRVFTEDVLRQAADFSYARSIRTRRGAQDLVYRMFAVATIELFRDAYPERGAPLGWLLSPRRHTLLTELGRIGHPRSDADGSLHWSDEDVARLISVALEVSERKPSTKAGVAMIRGRRAHQHAA